MFEFPYEPSARAWVGALRRRLPASAGENIDVRSRSTTMVAKKERELFVVRAMVCC